MNEIPPGEALPAVFDMDIGSDPDDTFVAAMVLGAPPRFRPALLITNDETASLGRARFLAGLASLAGADLPIVAGLPSVRRRERCLVEEAGLCPADARFEREGIQALIQVLEAHRRVRYFGLGALTNLAAALAARPDLAERIELVQMGPALRGAYPRERPQYNARLDTAAFLSVLQAVRRPTLVMSHSTWGSPGEGARQRIGVYPDDPLAGALRDSGPLTAMVVRHLEAWARTGKACSVMHDPLTVLSASVAGLVDFAPVTLALDGAGWAFLHGSSHDVLRALLPDRASSIADLLAAPRCATEGPWIQAWISLDTNHALLRRTLAEALLGEGGAAVALEWERYNEGRLEGDAT